MNNKSMREFKECYGTWALVAGAAEGIGEAFTESLAGRGMNLVMVDLNTAVLNSLAERIKKTYNVMTREVTLDLSDQDAWQICMNEIRELDCRLLIYIPAYSRVQAFLSNSPDELDKYIDLNTRTPIHLAHSFLNHIEDNGSAGILLMSSLAGLIGPPFLAPYSATKAFNILLAESLRSEMKGSRFKISVCCAGQTSTPAYWTSNPAKIKQWPPVMSPAKVAGYALKNLGKRTVLIPGWQNRVSYFLLFRILTRTFAAKIVDTALRKIYPEI